MKEEDILVMSADALRLAVADALKINIIKIPGRDPSGLFWNNPSGKFETLPDWPRDIAAAWKLVDKIRKTHVVEVGCGSIFWVSIFFEDYFFTPEYKAEDLSAPIAICRVYLLWKDGQRDQS